MTRVCRNRCRGFTAFELLVATSLATLMMLLLMGVLRGVTERQKSVCRARPVQTWVLALEQQIRWDLANSEWLQVRPRELRLVGYASRDFVTGEATFRPAEVRYTIESDRRQTWLVRTESHRDQLNNRNTKRQLLCADVTRLAFEPLFREEKGEQNRVEAKRVKPFDPDGSPMPPGVRLQLYTSDGNEPWFSRDIILR